MSNAAFFALQLENHTYRQTIHVTYLNDLWGKSFIRHVVGGIEQRRNDWRDPGLPYPAHITISTINKVWHYHDILLIGAYLACRFSSSKDIIINALDDMTQKPQRNHHLHRNTLWLVLQIPNISRHYQTSWIQPIASCGYTSLLWPDYI